MRSPFCDPVIILLWQHDAHYRYMKRVPEVELDTSANTVAGIPQLSFQHRVINCNLNAILAALLFNVPFKQKLMSWSFCFLVFRKIITYDILQVALQIGKHVEVVRDQV